MDNRKNRPKLQHRGREFQVPIYLGKLLRSFIYLNDWKMIPMAAVIAAMLSMVVRKDFFLTMEGTVKGSFALTCVAIWNGCFNSIQVICRERPIIKREHRSGMHISSYIFAHMVYQALLCLAQSLVTIYVCHVLGVEFPATGVVTGIGIVDITITLFLVTYASDMVSLLVSSLAHSTTAAMTVMPFVLIFQLVFSGGIFTLPKWTEPVSEFTISHYGLQCIAAQGNYNELPMVTGWSTIEKVQDEEITGSVTVGELMDAAYNKEGVLSQFRDLVVVTPKQAEEAADMMADSAAAAAEGTEQPADSTAEPAADAASAEPAAEPTAEPAASDATTVSDSDALVAQAVQQMGLEDENVQAMMAALLGEMQLPDELLQTADIAEQLYARFSANKKLTLGDIIDVFCESDYAQTIRDNEIPYRFKIRAIIDQYGRENLKQKVEDATAAAMKNANYDNELSNVLECWGSLILFAIAFAFISVIVLEFIDKDKR